MHCHQQPASTTSTAEGAQQSCGADCKTCSCVCISWAGSHRVYSPARLQTCTRCDPPQPTLSPVVPRYSTHHYRRSAVPDRQTRKAKPICECYSVAACLCSAPTTPTTQGAPQLCRAEGTYKHIMSVMMEGSIPSLSCGAYAAMIVAASLTAASIAPLKHMHHNSTNIATQLESSCTPKNEWG
jgi:hypothetical protein